MHSKLKGSFGELAVAKDLNSKGYYVFKEFGDLSKVDLIAECSETKKLHRIQIKYTSMSSVGSVIVSSKKSAKGYRFTYTSADFDILAIYCPEIDAVAYLNSKIFDELTTLTLRITDSLNSGGNSEFRYFKDFINIKQALRDYTHDTLPDNAEGDERVQTYKVENFSRKKKVSNSTFVRKTKIDWPSFESLLFILEEENFNLSSMGRRLGVSLPAVKKRLISGGLSFPLEKSSIGK